MLRHAKRAPPNTKSQRLKAKDLAVLRQTERAPVATRGDVQLQVTAPPVVAEQVVVAPVDAAVFVASPTPITCAPSIWNRDDVEVALLTTSRAAATNLGFTPGRVQLQCLTTEQISAAVKIVRNEEENEDEMPWTKTFYGEYQKSG